MKTSVNLSEYTTGNYAIGRNFLVVSCWFIVSALFFQNPLFPCARTKVWLLKLFGAKIGKKVNIKPSVRIKYPWKLSVGDNSWIGEGAWIDNLAQVNIGSNVCISQGALLLTGNHDYTKSSFDLIVKEIVIEDGAWVCAKSIVCPGVTLKSHSVLGVGSVANKDLEPYCIYAGNRAIKIKERVPKI